ncbi:MAG: co-chaperone GroES [candidate division WS1 bacterium]|jgi:chaperonin GroES|nr:co-chaperone GroES [candidate division WS1 bacterium]
MSIRVLGNRVMVKRAEADTTAGGIHLPESAQERPQKATVVSVGEGRKLDDGTVVAPGVSEGDTVIISKYGGTEITVDGEEYLIMDVGQLLAREV